MRKLFCFCLLLGWLLSLAASIVAADGHDPLDDMTFFGESTTAHLALRGGIPGERVWANASGTMKLDSGILSKSVTDPRTGQARTVVEMAATYQPHCLVLSFGLNGILHFSKSTGTYLHNYRCLIDAVREVSPDTQILVQAVYPVADATHQTAWRFSESPAEVNRKISMLNECLAVFCADDVSLTYCDTAAVLTDDRGFLRADYTTDGIHLTQAAYLAVKDALRKSAQT